MRRIALFLGTNIAVLFLLSIVCHLLGVDQMAAARGFGGSTGLLIYAAVFGMGGAFISLAMSKWMAKMSTGARVIEQPANEAERWPRYAELYPHIIASAPTSASTTWSVRWS